MGIAEERPVDGDRSVVETNFFGVVRVTNAEFSDIRARRQRRIINVGSLAAWVGEPGEAFEPASSYALAGYTRALRHGLWREESTSHRWDPPFSKPVLWTLPQLLQVPSQVVMSCVRLRITCSMKVFGSVRPGQRGAPYLQDCPRAFATPLLRSGQRVTLAAVPQSPSATESFRLDPAKCLLHRDERGGSAPVLIRRQAHKPVIETHPD